ncbi:MAG: lipid A deacylase LpxR family protein [Chryseobacterium sp.]|nr:MAG: lipid A deacylase LpxR family protein [Chryseobacterium sp.]
MAILSFFCLSSNAQTYQHEFGFQSDNDSYLGQGSDRYYTNGLFLHYRFATDQSKLKAGMEKKIWEISAGQKMYNPYSGYAPDPTRQDRPFAGYLYAGLALDMFKANESNLKTSLELGATGPNSIAQDAQNLLHRNFGFYTLDGWQYQIHNAFQANLSAKYTKLMYRNAQQSADFSFEGYANLGTTFSGAGAGILFRTGNINQLFNSAYEHAVIGKNATTKALVKREFFFYAKPQLNYVAYDATISGNIFSDNSPVTFDTHPIVFAQQLGANYSSQRFTFDFGVIFKTKEVKSSAKAHQYGSISMFYRFN